MARSWKAVESTGWPKEQTIDVPVPAPSKGWVNPSVHQKKVNKMETSNPDTTLHYTDTCLWCNLHTLLTADAFEQAYKYHKEELNKTSIGWTKEQIESLGLDVDMDLTQKSAEFYVSLSLSLRGCTAAVQEHERIAKELAEQLCRYLEIASLGEARHAIGKLQGWIKASAYQKPVADLKGNTYHADVGRLLRQIYYDRGVRGRKTFGYKILPVRQQRETGLLERWSFAQESHRMFVWLTWEDYLKKWPNLHELLTTIFEGNWQDGGYGGKRWATCIRTAHMYRDGMPATLFVDLALGLKHNGNIAYDKVWSLGLLTKVLTANLQDKLSTLVPIVSPKLQELWTSTEGEKNEHPN